jgi:uncharacterized LabA/DUF88 family protein
MGHNQAFIDGQNFYYGTTKAIEPWKVDIGKFRIYLREKYGVAEAYYFLGYYDDTLTDLYDDIQSAGFILKFRKHNSAMAGKKKGNVDTDIVFSIMRKLYEQEDMNKVILVSGDGDYWRMVDFLIKEGRFAKLLAPSRLTLSSLYRKLEPRYYDSLDKSDIKQKIAK